MEIIDITKEGLGVAKKDNKVYFIKNAIYGEVVSIKDEIKKGNIIYCKKDKTINKSRHITDNDLVLNILNPNANLKDLKYDTQLDLKKKMVENAVNRIGKIDNFKINKMVSCDEKYIYNYRNKTRFKIKNNMIGYFKPNTNKIVEINECILSSSGINLSLSILKKLISDIKNNELKNSINTFKIIEVTIKENYNNLITIEFEVDKKDLNYKSEEYKNIFDKIVKLIKKEFTNELEKEDFENKETKYILANVVFKSKYKTIYEDKNENVKFLRKIGKYLFNVSTNSFFQVNKYMNEKLYNEVLESLDSIEKILNYNNDTLSNKNMLELYSGVGSIGIYVNKYFKNILGVEVVKDATINSISNLELNKKVNNIDSNKYKYITSKSEEIDSKLYSEIDVVIVDPPRAGLDKKVIENIVKNTIEYIIYISCDYGTLARDLKLFKENNYNICEFKLVDMFPNTTHIESVVIIKKEKIN